MQTDYNDLAVGVEGGLGDAGHHDIATRKCAVAVAFGLGLAVSAEGESAIPAVTGFVFEGVAVQKHSAQSNSTDLAQYDPDTAISVLRKGRIWVKTETVVAVTDPVYLKFSTADGAGGTPGAFRNDAQVLATFDHADLVANARWLSSAAAGGLALLEINLP